MKGFYEKIEDYLSGTLIISGLSLIFIGVIWRYLLNNPLSWVGEISNYLIVWGILIGTAVALRDNHHIHVDAIYDRVSERMKKIFNVFSNVLGIAFCIFLMIYSGKLILMYFQTQQKSIEVGIELWIVYLILPITALMLGFRFLEKLINCIRRGEVA